MKSYTFAFPVCVPKKIFNPSDLDACLVFSILDCGSDEDSLMAALLSYWNHTNNIIDYL